MSACKLRLAALFSDCAILQREIGIPVWGWMRPKSRIRVSLGGKAVQSLSGADGKFLVRLPAMPAGGPYELVAESLDDNQKVIVKDVWVGEVWLASGQSNMQWTFTDNKQEELADLVTPEIRVITIPRLALAGRQSEVQAEWQQSTEETLPQFGAVAYHFARRLQNELGVMVGIVNNAWGGTIVEAWTSRESIMRNPDIAPWLHSVESVTQTPEFWAPYAKCDLSDPAQRGMAHLVEVDNESTYPEDPGNEGEAKSWSQPGFNDAAWPEMKLPGHWNTRGQNFSGVFWFRKTVEIPASWENRELELSLGAVDKHDTTYFNGSKIGSTGAGFEEYHWNIPRNYTVSGGLVKAGRAVIAVRAYSFVHGGGLIGPSTDMHLRLAGTEESVPLAGNWHFEVEHNFGQVVPVGGLQLPPGPGVANTPGILFDNLVAPLLPYAMRGVIWYQGESNAGSGFAVSNLRYARAMREMIRDWRFAWGQGDFPFIQVQLANYREEEPYQEESEWARLRESQRLALSEPNTGMAVAIDVGDVGNIHPADKLSVGNRLAQWALAKTYHKPIVPSGPLYAGMAIEGDKIRIRFDCVGGGLIEKGGALRTFYIAGRDQHFIAATAVIEGDTVLVSSMEVGAPLAVRYAWADNPVGCNLYNAEGLPASPFRTDSW